jgi:radical SAM protein with 4Fe4S-binding SPASM domain
MSATENNSDSFCSLPWNHLVIDTWGTVIPCCRFKTNVEQENYPFDKTSAGLDAAWNNSAFRRLREEFVSGNKPAPCVKCWLQEDNSSKSMRTAYNNIFRSRTDVSNKKLRFIEIGFSTHCNLACRMCSPDYSSKWATIKYPNNSVRIGYELDVDKFDVDVSELEEIKIVGGEPMMAKQHDQFLQKLFAESLNLSNVKITYHTNGTVLPSKTVLDLWKHIGEIDLILSVDGIGKINEYQRPGHKWSTVEKNVKFYKQLANEYGNISLGVHSAITTLNIMHIHEVIEWYQDNINSKMKNFSYDFVDYPFHLNIANLNNKWKDSIVKYINNSVNVEKLQHSFIGYIKMNQQVETPFTVSAVRLKERKLDEYFKQKSILK